MFSTRYRIINKVSSNEERSCKRIQYPSVGKINFSKLNESVTFPRAVVAA